MKKEISKTLIGAFILGAVAIAVIGILAFGRGGLFQESNRYVMYFTGSVKGLRLGAPVQLKGVPVGTVSRMNLVYSLKTKSFLTQVVIDVPNSSVRIAEDPDAEGPRKEALTSEESIDHMIESGLRAKLGLQSFVTGQLLVALDFYPDTPATLMNFENDIKELPTLPSDMDALAKTLDGLDFHAIAESVKNAVGGIEKLANSPGLHEVVKNTNATVQDVRRLANNLDRHVASLSAELTATMADMRHLAKTVDGQVPPVAEGITETAADIRKAVQGLDNRLQPLLENIQQTSAAAQTALKQAEAMMANLTYLSDEDSTVVYRLNEALTEMRKAAGALTVLADYLGRHPEALLQGKAGPKENK